MHRQNRQNLPCVATSLHGRRMAGKALYGFTCLLVGLAVLAGCQRVNPIVQVSGTVPSATSWSAARPSAAFAQQASPEGHATPSAASSQPALAFRVIPITPATLHLLPPPSLVSKARGGFDRNLSYPPADKPGTYILGKGDELEIVVHRPVSLDAEGKPLSFEPQSYTAMVDNRGQVVVPLAGKLGVAGNSLAGAQSKIRAAVANYIKQPDVFVRITKYGSQHFSVGGAVRNPGVFPLGQQSLSLSAALQQAGGLSVDDSDRSFVTLVRGSKRYTMPAAQVARGDLPERVLVQSGDELIVEQDDNPDVVRPRHVYVGGEVLSPQRLSLPHNLRSPMTLADVLFEAKGWISSQADPRQIYIIRSVTSPGGYPPAAHIFQLDLSHAANFVLATRVPLHADDFVFVATKPVAHWNATLSQVLPSLQAGALLRQVTGL